MERKEQIKANFARRLTKLRVEQNLSIRGLAARSGMEYSHVQKIVSGKVDVSLTTIHLLADALNVPAANLLIE